jgi:hypothetical protein
MFLCRRLSGEVRGEPWLISLVRKQGPGGSSDEDVRAGGSASGGASMVSMACESGWRCGERGE